MATTINAILADIYDLRYGENVLNKNLTFYKAFSANVVSGTGLANASSDFTFSNGRSLFVNNLSNSDTLAINSGGTFWESDISSYRSNQNSVFQFSIYNSSGISITGRFRLFSLALEIYTVEFEVSDTGKFITFYQNVTIPNGTFDIVFELDSDAINFNECYISGIKLEYDQNQTYTPTIYSGYIPIELEETQTIDLPSIASLATQTQTATLTGAEVGDYVQMTYPPALITSGLVVGFPIVTATDTISFIVYNPTVGAVDPASANYTFKIVK